MKYILLTILLLLSASCSDVHRDSNDAELEFAAEAGRKSGSAAAKLPEGSMEQQKALLEIRSRESAIREAGYPSSADTFAIEADKAFWKKSK